jgi:hypothetical protein
MYKKLIDHRQQDPAASASVPDSGPVFADSIPAPRGRLNPGSFISAAPEASAPVRNRWSPRNTFYVLTADEDDIADGADKGVSLEGSSLSATVGLVMARSTCSPKDLVVACPVARDSAARQRAPASQYQEPAPVDGSINKPIVIKEEPESDQDSMLGFIRV